MCAIIFITAVVLSGLISYAATEFTGVDILRYICNDLGVAMSWRQKTNILHHSKFLMRKICQSYTCLVVEIILLGIYAVGIYGLGFGIYNDAFQNGHGILRERLHFLGLPLLWLYAMDRTGRIRIIFVLGGILSAKKMYADLTMSTRRLALLFGDSVCDINN